MYEVKRTLFASFSNSRNVLPIFNLEMEAWGGGATWKPTACSNRPLEGHNWALYYYEINSENTDFADIQHQT